MAWQGIEGHDAVVELFRAAVGRGRLASSFLFVGPEGIGKRAFALKLAQTLLCSTRPAAQLDPCGSCPSCSMLLGGSHPDVVHVSKPADKSELPVELLIGDLDHRGREGLCHDISLKPYMGGRKVAIIDDADYLNEAGANSLLKTLEEPPPHSLLILIGTSPAKQLPTIRSRCQIVRFMPLSGEIVAKLLLAQEKAADLDEARRLASFCGGSLQKAVALADPDLWQFRHLLYQHLAVQPLAALELSRAMIEFIDTAGKEARARRSRFQQIVEFAVEFYRGQLRSAGGAPLNNDPELSRFVEQSRARGPIDEEAAAQRIERCLDTSEQIERNVHQATLVESWLDSLARG